MLLKNTNKQAILENKYAKIFIVCAVHKTYVPQKFGKYVNDNQGNFTIKSFSLLAKNKHIKI